MAVPPTEGCRHEADAVEIEGEEDGFQSRPGEREGGLAAGVSRADDLAASAVYSMTSVSMFINLLRKMDGSRGKIRPPFVVICPYRRAGI